MRSVAVLFVCAVCSFSFDSFALSSVFVDEDGVMRWSESSAEVALFGVNYTTPFAHAFRAHKRLGVALEEAIDADVYHLSRLGLDAYRVHVWDREISDPEGNLVENEHLRAFDYLLAKLKERGIKIVLTPLQFGNAAYPEPGVPLNGFSSAYGKQGCLENKESWPLQERYLSQFVSHMNPHTGLAYKDDPDIIVFEICNEPGHFEYRLTLDYINRMVASIRGTGCDKPIFYNMSHGLANFRAYLDANVQGSTFQWYPANLVAGHEQRGNFLPYVDRYEIPFAQHPGFHSKARLVYEFDAADIGRSYIYPAIARTYRSVRMQVATMFAYDPVNIAPFNTEYPTHYMNLAYAPSKALGLAVTAEAFRRVGLGKDYGGYPENTEFEGVRVDYRHDLAEVVDDEIFLYSNDTGTPPPNPGLLRRIAGVGSSPVVTYPGHGAYFLDRVEAGVWRLEVMPDAIWVRDPFAAPSPQKQVARISWNAWPISVRLPDLGIGFRARGLNDGNEFRAAADETTLTVSPGVYLLTRRGIDEDFGAQDRCGNLALGEFSAPQASVDKTYVVHNPVIQAQADQDLVLRALVVSDKHVVGVEAAVYLPEHETASVTQENSARAQPGGGNTPGVGPRNTGGLRVFAMERAQGFEYKGVIPEDVLTPGELRYSIVVRTVQGVTSFPSGIDAHPRDWLFYGEHWHAQVVPGKSPIVLFEAAHDRAMVTADFRDVRYPLVPASLPGRQAMRVIAQEFPRDVVDHSFRFWFSDKIEYRTSDLSGMSTLVVFCRAARGARLPIQVALVTKDGIAYGSRITVEGTFKKIPIPLDGLQQVRSPTIPHGYPVFIDFWSQVEQQIPFDITQVESVLVSLGFGQATAASTLGQGIDLERVWLE